MSRDKSDPSSQHPAVAKAHWIFILLLALLTADLATLYARKYFLPYSAPPPRAPKFLSQESMDRSQYDVIVRRNIFSGDNVIPDPLQGEGGSQQQESAPVPSSLPLTLVGTLVHSNPEKSIAAIEVKGKNQVISYSVKQNIENVATLEKVERGKVIFRNTANGRLEYIELPQTGKLAFESAAKSAIGGVEIKQLSEGNFELSRLELDKQLSDITGLLQQATSVPARRPGTGEVYGFRILSVNPDSVLNQLIKPMDVITSANGSPVTSMQQAMELYNTLRNSPRVCLTVERDGRPKENCYNIK